jgi:5-oxoprolinase (ATP-hydrolysing)
MGEALQRTSFSVNVKERLDYSCAVLDAEARLVACAPHVPVHLGSLGVCVREVLGRVSIAPGDVVVTNHPACGGSHLPDVTVIRGAFDRDGRVLGYVAARAHHAEIGGVRPGSMPPNAARLSEEGVVIAPMHAVRAGVPRFDALKAALTSGPFPTRALQANLEDINAAIAACARGTAEIESLASSHGSPAVHGMMAAIQDRSALAAEQTIAGMGNLDLMLADELDDGTPLRVRVTADRGRGGLTLDFTGTAGVHAGNLNATPAIVNSCVLYVVRVMAQRDLPLNEGLMRPVRVVLPRGLLNPPFDPDADPATQPAVVGGNVEASQRLVNMLLRGLGVCAESQGTMNNLIFGDDTRSYYETICGGAGAGFDGASAVHTHMTNTRITDPEILERRYPVRLERFAVRRGSGGAGTHRGGDGVERVIRFLSPMIVSVLTQRRVRGPRGLGGGGDGARGEQWIERAGGQIQPLASVDGAEVGLGDTVVIRTPGGGGWTPA